MTDYTICMAELTKKQQLNLIDLVEAVVDQIPIPDSLIKDLMVVYRFLVLSKDQSAVVFSFVNLLTPQQKSELTRRDVLTEEVMLELHLIHGFDQLDLVQWLRWIDFGGMCFFNDHAHSKNVLHLDQIMDRARLTIVVIDGVRIDSVLGYFESLDQLIEYTISKRITFKQFRQLLVMLNQRGGFETIG